MRTFLVNEVNVLERLAVVIRPSQPAYEVRIFIRSLPVIYYEHRPRQ